MEIKQQLSQWREVRSRGSQRPLLGIYSAYSEMMLNSKLPRYGDDNKIFELINNKNNTEEHWNYVFKLDQ